MQLLKMALNAVVDPIYMQPSTMTQNELNTRHHIGTSQVSLTAAKYLLKRKPLSLPKDQIKRDVVCCAALVVKNSENMRQTWKTVLAALLLVACSHSAYIGSLGEGNS